MEKEALAESGQIFENPQPVRVDEAPFVIGVLEVKASVQMSSLFACTWFVFWKSCVT
jgi:hypothetical protein